MKVLKIAATNLQKCLNTPDLWFQFTYFTAFFFFNSYIGKKNHKNNGMGKPVIKVIGTDFIPCAQSPRFYTSGKGICRKILVAMFSSSCLKHMDMVKCSKTPPIPHIFIVMLVKGLEPALLAFQKTLENKFWSLGLNRSLFPGVAGVAESCGNPWPQRCPVYRLPAYLPDLCWHTWHGVHQIIIKNYRLSWSFAYCRQNVLISGSNGS